MKEINLINAILVEDYELLEDIYKKETGEEVEEYVKTFLKLMYELAKQSYKEGYRHAQEGITALIQ